MIAEAFACATPTVASDIPGYAAVAIPEAARLVPPGDPDALAAAVIDVLSDEERRVEMGRAGACTRDRQLRVGRSRAQARGDVHRGGGVKRWRYLLVVPLLAFAVSLIVWRGPDWHLVHDAFTAVSWKWVVAAIGLNLLSVLSARARLGHRDQAVDHASASVVSDASSRPSRVGLFANAVLPGRVGELARVAVLRRRLTGRRGPGTTATLVGSVFAHRIFDLFPALTLVIWVLFSAKIPQLGAHLDLPRARGRRHPLPDRRTRREGPAA